MENMGTFTELMRLGMWGNYTIWILLYALMIIACAIGLKRTKNPAFIFILISISLNLIHHLPSIFINYRSFADPGSLLGVKMQEYISEYYVASGFVSLLAAILMVIGLFILVKKNVENPA